MAVWDQSADELPDPPDWSLTGHMLLWSDGSPAHVQMESFVVAGNGWDAALTISRSARDATRWLPLVMRLPAEVRKQWDAQGTSSRARALQSLANYLRLTEWYDDDLGVLELK
jgi:hypothetical protein